MVLFNANDGAEVVQRVNSNKASGKSSTGIFNDTVSGPANIYGVE